MKRITNINDPNNVIIVSDAYINGDRIVCITEEDEFDLWRNCWKLEDLPEQPVDGLEEAADEYSAGIIDREDAFMCKAAFIAGYEFAKKPTDCSLEEEIDLYMEKNYDYNSEYDTLTPNDGFFFSPRHFRNLARHFFELGKNARKEK